MFSPASRAKNRLRLALCGPTGSGKTYTAILLAHALVEDGQRIAFIDTEHGSAAKYVGTKVENHVWAWDVVELENYSPARYVDAITAAAEAGYEVLIIDSLSHAWVGVGGALDQVDNSKEFNKFAAWRGVTPQHNALVESMLAYPGHLIACMRTKIEYVLESDEKGRAVPRKIGTKPVQRDGIEYEFDLVADLDHQHTLTVSKTRCPSVDGDVIHRPGGAWIAPIKKWLIDGADVKPKPRAAIVVQDAPVHAEAPEELAPAPAPKASTGKKGPRKIDPTPTDKKSISPNKGGPWTQAHQDLADKIMVCAGNDVGMAQQLCANYAAFTSKDGKRVLGPSSVGDMSLQWVLSTLAKKGPGSLRDDYQAAKAEDVDAAQELTNAIVRAREVFAPPAEKKPAKKAAIEAPHELDELDQDEIPF